MTKTRRLHRQCSHFGQPKPPPLMDCRPVIEAFKRMTTSGVRTWWQMGRYRRMRQYTLDRAAGIRKHWRPEFDPLPLDQVIKMDAMTNQVAVFVNDLVKVVDDTARDSTGVGNTL
jgi:hypothetical protein